MKSALILSRAATSIAVFAELLQATSCSQIVTAKSCGEARRILVERDFDLVIINAPLQDETGETLAREIAAHGASQVMLIVGREFFDEISNKTEGDGVLTVAKPLNKEVLWATLKLAEAAYTRLSRMQEENKKLVQKIEDIRIVDRAKCILISRLGICEEEAHRFIEKQAMDMRQTRRIVAEGILRTYEN